MRDTDEVVGQTFLQIGATRADILQQKEQVEILNKIVESEINTAKKHNERFHQLADDFTYDNF